MVRTRAQLEAVEAETLAPYAVKSRDSRGRAYPEPEASLRTAFQRDRDRILHTTAFRRLEYKTQVFVTSEGDYYRTRLTHTLEVAQIGRSIARSLGANEDLIEAICLGHDLGHPPFGHAGEASLAGLMQAHGGFNHNKQSLRIITELEQRYPDFPGLNLTWELREGIVKHETEYDIADAAGYEPEKRGHLEAQIANAADELAYTAHDLDDGLRSGLVLPGQLTDLALWQRLRESSGWDGRLLDDMTRHQMIRDLIGLEIADLLRSTEETLQASGADSVEAIQRLLHNVVVYSDSLAQANQTLKDFLYHYLYQHFQVVRMQVKAERTIEDLFRAYLQTPEILPDEVRDRTRTHGLERTVCDYIAGMTDRYATQEHGKLFDPQILP
jgi:dGTPase